MKATSFKVHALNYNQKFQLQISFESSGSKSNLNISFGMWHSLLHFRVKSAASFIGTLRYKFNFTVLMSCLVKFNAHCKVPKQSAV